MNSPTVGGAARTAWLLAANRVLGSNPDHVHRDRFIAALREQGVSADAPRLSRWEGGTHAVPAHVIRAYERLLDRPKGQFSAVAGGLDRALAGDQAKVRTTAVDPDPRRLDELVDLCERGRPTGGDWLSLTEHLGRFEHVFLPDRTWKRLTTRLVTELGRAVGPGYCRRHEASAALICSPVAQRQLVKGIGRLVTQPSAQVVAAPLTLLQEISTTHANELVLRLVASDNPALRSASTSVAAHKVASGHFDDDELDRLARRTDQWLRGEDRERRVDALDLAAHLPERHWTRLMGAVRHAPLRHQLEAARESFELLPSDVTRTVCRALATSAQAATPAPYTTEPDAMLRRLLREALFHVHKARRLHASFLLAASPYARALGHALVPLTQDPNDFLASRAWSLLGHVGHGDYRQEVARVALGNHRPALQARALVNLGLAPTPLGDDEAETVLGILESGAPRPVEHAATYALGMTGHPALTTVIEQGSAAQRAAAEWWRDTGPAVHDADVVA